MSITFDGRPLATVAVSVGDVVFAIRERWRRGGRRGTPISRYLSSDKGDLVAELDVVIPVVVIGLIMGVNLLMFAAECAKFDRVAAEVARSVVLGRSIGECENDLRAKLKAGMGYGPSSRHTVKVEIKSRYGSLATDHVVVESTLTFIPWPSPSLPLFTRTYAEWETPFNMQHRQVIVVDAFKPGIVFE